jgi:recombination protein RecR
MIPNSIKRFIEAFSNMPSIGPRQATRLAFYLASLDKATVDELERAVGGLKNLNRCEKCFFFKEGQAKYCAICSSPERDPKTIAIVEKETDLLTLEKTGRFKGTYLVLGKLADKGVIETAQKLRLASLKKRVASDGGALNELIIALNPTSIGDFTADLIKSEFKDLAAKITRLARGIPTGGEIEFADEETLNSAFGGRH